MIDNHSVALRCYINIHIFRRGLHFKYGNNYHIIEKTAYIFLIEVAPEAFRGGDPDSGNIILTEGLYTWPKKSKRL